ncbi:MAG: 4Fe-4S binding protein, partial [bacterium]|nr:4Fe-4S binding protein [bacterium]
KEANVKYRPVETGKTGILIAGTANSPMNIYETVQQAKAVVVRVLEFALKEKIKARDEISTVSRRKCSGCMMCIEACPYDARFLDQDTKTAAVISSICQGCGLCTMVCPNNAAELVGQETKTMRTIIDSII